MHWPFHHSAMNTLCPRAFLLWILLLGSLLVPGGLTRSVRGAETSSVSIIALEGTVEVAPAGTDNWAPAKLNQRLQPGDKLRTG
jgi:hypothetical protein